MAGPDHRRQLGVGVGARTRLGVRRRSRFRCRHRRLGRRTPRRPRGPHARRRRLPAAVGHGCARSGRACRSTARTTSATVSACIRLGRCASSSASWSRFPSLRTRRGTNAARRWPGFTQTHLPFLVVQGTSDNLVSPDESRAFVDKLRTNSSAVVAYAEVPRGQHAFDAVASVRTGHVINGVAPLPQPRPLRVPPDGTIVDDDLSACRRRPGRPPLTCSPTPQVRACPRPIRHETPAVATPHAEPSRPDVRGLQGGRGRRVGLVLGAGGAAGAAYHAGALLALQQDTGWDPRTADVVVGTSIGSIVASLLRAGLSTDDLAAWGSGVEPLPAGAAARTLIDHISADPLRMTIPRLTGMLGGLRQVMPNARRLIRPSLAALSTMLPHGFIDAARALEQLGESARRLARSPAVDASGTHPRRAAGRVRARRAPTTRYGDRGVVCDPVAAASGTNRQAPLHRWRHPLSDQRRPACRRRRRRGHRDRTDVRTLRGVATSARPRPAGCVRSPTTRRSATTHPRRRRCPPLRTRRRRAERPWDQPHRPVTNGSGRAPRLHGHRKPDRSVTHGSSSREWPIHPISGIDPGPLRAVVTVAAALAKDQVPALDRARAEWVIAAVALRACGVCWGWIQWAW